MAFINNLPRRCLYQILLYACGEPAKTVESWKSKLPLLWTCRQWACLLFEDVFDRAIVTRTFIDAPDDEIMKWQSNVDCIANRRCYNQIKCCYIHIVGNHDNSQVNQTLADILMLTHIDWLSIKLLDISFRGFWRIMKESLLFGPNASAVLARRLISQMPNIIHLCIQDNNAEFNNIAVLYQPIVDGYASQLRSIKMEPIIPTDIRHFSSHLTSLTVRFSTPDHFSPALPRVCADTLQLLCLQDVLPTFSWQPFYNCFTPGRIVFKSLACLEIRFVTRFDELCTGLDAIELRDPAYEIQFPKLKQLVLLSCPRTSDFMFATFNESTLCHVRLAGTLENIAHYCHAKRKLRSFELYLYKQDDNLAQNFYELTSEMFGQRRNHKQMKLILDSADEIDFMKVSWAHLDELTIAILPISLDVLLNIFANIPWLERLKLSYLRISDEDIASDELQLDSFFNSEVDVCLKLFEITVCPDPSPHSRTRAIINRLLFHLHMLETLSVPRCIFDAVKQHIYEASAEWPHLSTIIVKSSVFSFQPH